MPVVVYDHYPKKLDFVDSNLLGIRSGLHLEESREVNTILLPESVRNGLAMVYRRAYIILAFNLLLVYRISFEKIDCCKPQRRLDADQHGHSGFYTLTGTDTWNIPRYLGKVQSYIQKGYKLFSTTSLNYTGKRTGHF